jgi:hypothetical protein
MVYRKKKLCNLKILKPSAKALATYVPRAGLGMACFWLASPATAMPEAGQSL